jgi:Flp pilus assembly secretin CpaC
MRRSPDRSARARPRALVLAFALMACGIGLRSAAADTLTVVLDQAQVMTLPDRVGTIVVGNPLIADVSLQAGGTLVVTGRGYGTTNIIALDRAGATLMTKSVLVVGPRDNVVVYRGVDRESYSCAPRCERRITLGDASASGTR